MMPEDNVVQYIAHIDSTLTVDPIDIGKNFNCTMTVEIDEPTVEYVANIQGSLFVWKNIAINTIDSFFTIEKNEVDIDIDSSIQVPGWFEGDYGVLGNVRLPGYIESEYDIDGVFDLPLREYQYDINTEFSIPWKFEDQIVGYMSMYPEEYNYDFNSTLRVGGICYNDNAMIGKVLLLWDMYDDNIIEGDVNYLPASIREDIDGTLNIEDHIHSVYFHSSINVLRKHYRYSMYSRMRVVPRYDYDIDSSITVINDQIYDIPCINANLYPVYDTYDLIDGSLSLPEYTINEIDGSLTIDKVYTRRDFSCYMYAVRPIIYDFDCSIHTYTPYHRMYTMIPCRMKVGNNIRYDIPCSIDPIPAVSYNKDLFDSRIRVITRLSPFRIGIVVDPLWHYEPFVLKSSLITFFDRIYTKNKVSIVYGGNPRSDWDIENISKAFGTPRNRLYKVPLIYNSHDREYMKMSVEQYIHTLFTFTPKDEHRFVDRVFIFSDKNPKFDNAIISPIIEVCMRYHIPCVIINSHGDYDEVGLPHRHGPSYNYDIVTDIPKPPRGPNHTHVCVHIPHGKITY